MGRGTFRVVMVIFYSDYVGPVGPCRTLFPAVPAGIPFPVGPVGPYGVTLIL